MGRQRRFQQMTSKGNVLVLSKACEISLNRLKVVRRSKMEPTSACCNISVERTRKILIRTQKTVRDIRKKRREMMYRRLSRLEEEVNKVCSGIQHPTRWDPQADGATPPSPFPAMMRGGTSQTAPAMASGPLPPTIPAMARCIAHGTQAPAPSHLQDLTSTVPPDDIHVACAHLNGCPSDEHHAQRTELASTIPPGDIHAACAHLNGCPSDKHHAQRTEVAWRHSANICLHLFGLPMETRPLNSPASGSFASSSFEVPDEAPRLPPSCEALQHVLCLPPFCEATTPAPSSYPASSREATTPAPSSYPAPSREASEATPSSCKPRQHRSSSSFDAATPANSSCGTSEYMPPSCEAPQQQVSSFDAPPRKASSLAVSEHLPPSSAASPMAPPSCAAPQAAPCSCVASKQVPSFRGRRPHLPSSGRTYIPASNAMRSLFRRSLEAPLHSVDKHPLHTQCPAPPFLQTKRLLLPCPLRQPGPSLEAPQCMVANNQPIPDAVLKGDNQPMHAFSSHHSNLQLLAVIFPALASQPNDTNPSFLPVYPQRHTAHHVDMVSHFYCDHLCLYFQSILALYMVMLVVPNYLPLLISTEVSCTDKSVHSNNCMMQRSQPQMWSLSHLQQQRPLLWYFVLHSNMSALAQRSVIQSQVSHTLECLLLIFHHMPRNLRWPAPESKLNRLHTNVQKLPNIQFGVLDICQATNPVDINHFVISLSKHHAQSMTTIVFTYQPFDPGILQCCISQLERGELVISTSLSYADFRMRDHKNGKLLSTTDHCAKQRLDAQPVQQQSTVFYLKSFMIHTSLLL
ncbi:hypothetical protein KP509_03G008800 [Ceratopteris richardii]|uniref:Uncharacterized protein n=1 Tax=Ceratopteris richardii TaxID=49495 RepID=A0A8T2V4J7_CERRI|nr:hypothetical protein KP509_03G008800 [Ceratopteris richardii]